MDEPEPVSRVSRRPQAVAAPPGEETPDQTPVLTVVVPVFNLEESVVENVRTIRERIEALLGEPFELVVVSDGSADRTQERMLEARDPATRILHYDRNLGKGYAIKTGALEARGRWVAYVDADLDLDPSYVPQLLETAEAKGLDIVIGSKRHPESEVQYPRSRRAASWLYQQLVRVLFRLDVRDTQVGLKVFRREVAEQVLPLLIVKRYAFDLELLAVSRALGFDRIAEAPIRLDYRFTGSGVRSVAVLRALVDTAAVFYRLRVLRYYQRKRGLVGALGWTRPRLQPVHVDLFTTRAEATGGLDYPDVRVVELAEDSPRARREAAASSDAEVIAFVEADGRPAANWLSGTVPFLVRPEIAAVVTPSVAPLNGSVYRRAAAGTWESRIGGGTTHFRFTPGNIRYVREYPTASVVVRRRDFLEAVASDDDVELLPERLVETGRSVLYTPEAVVVVPQPPLFRPHLRAVARYAGIRAETVRRIGLRAMHPSTLAVAVLLPALTLGAVGIVAGGEPWLALGLVPWAVYLSAVVAAAVVAGFRFRSTAVAGLVAAALPLTHVVYVSAFAAGLLRPRRA